MTFTPPSSLAVVGSVVVTIAEQPVSVTVDGTVAVSDADGLALLDELSGTAQGNALTLGLIAAALDAETDEVWVAENGA